MSMKNTGSLGISRRTFITGATALVASPYIISRAHAAGSQVVVRTNGGAYEEALTEVIFKPFTEQTGIEVIKASANAGKLTAMAKAGTVEIDVLDLGRQLVIQFDKLGYLEDLDYNSWKFTDLTTVDPASVEPKSIGHTYFSNIIGYNTNLLTGDKVPKSWSDVWDATRIPGARMLTDISAGWIDLEIALLADGVSMDKLYPIDVDRAFASLDRIKQHIRKYWDSGALSVQMLADGEVVTGSIMNTRIIPAIAKGAPLGYDWSGGKLMQQCWGIMKGTDNLENAQQLIDFAMRPESQAGIGTRVQTGPTNSACMELIPHEIAVRLPSYPENREKQFVSDERWWAENREAMADRWSRWLLEN